MQFNAAKVSLMAFAILFKIFSAHCEGVRNQYCSSTYVSIIVKILKNLGNDNFKGIATFSIVLKSTVSSNIRKLATFISVRGHSQNTFTARGSI